MSRPSFDEYIMNIATLVATRATCDRQHVGAVIVKDKHILSTGYNGSLPGQPHCDEVGHLMEHDHCIRTVHAEANAILYAARHGVELRDSVIYTTASPCWLCLPAVIQAGITEIVFGKVYRDTRVFELAEKVGVRLRRFPECSNHQFLVGNDPRCKECGVRVHVVQHTNRTIADHGGCV